jgi:hypothetical protein
VSTINTGKGRTWSEMLLLALERLPHNNILLLQEDFLLIKEVDSAVILHYLDIFRNEGATSLKLFPLPAPDKLFKSYADVGVIEKGTRFRVSLQAAFWNKSKLKQLTDAKESIQYFELNGTVRAEQDEAPYLSVLGKKGTRPEDNDYPITYIFTAIQAGLWMPRAVKYCQAHGIELNLNYRKVMTSWRWFYVIHAPLFCRHVMDFLHVRLNRYLGINLNESKRLPMFNIFNL